LGTVDGDIEVGIFGDVAVVEEEEHDEAEGGGLAAFGDDA